MVRRGGPEMRSLFRSKFKNNLSLYGDLTLVIVLRLYLNRSMGNSKALAEYILNRCKQSLLGMLPLCRHMGGEGDYPAGYGPYVQVMDSVYPIDLQNRIPDLIDVNMARGAFHQNRNHLFEQLPRGV